MKFVKCDLCGKKLIVKNDDGTLHFIFGKKFGDAPPVDITIDGNIKIKCIRNGCKGVTEIIKGD